MIAPRPPAGAGGATRSVNRERVLLLGWGRAVLLQLAHPLVAAGVAEHSRVLAGPGGCWRRLHRTLGAMLALTCGAPEDAARAARAINAAHARVRGCLGESAGGFAAGTAYAALDPALLLWVHATTLDSFLRAHERYVGPLTGEEADRYCAEMSLVAPLLGLPAGEAPASAVELRRYVEEMLASEQVAVTDAARELAGSLLAAPFPGAWLLGWFARLATAGLLPPAVRRAYVLPWGRRHELAFRLSAALVRRLLPALPVSARHWPSVHPDR